MRTALPLTGIALALVACVPPGPRIVDPGPPPLALPHAPIAVAVSADDPALLDAALVSLREVAAGDPRFELAGAPADPSGGALLLAPATLAGAQTPAAVVHVRVRARGAVRHDVVPLHHQEGVWGRTAAPRPDRLAWAEVDLRAAVGGGTVHGARSATGRAVGSSAVAGTPARLTADAARAAWRELLDGLALAPPPVSDEPTG